MADNSSIEWRNAVSSKLNNAEEDVICPLCNEQSLSRKLIWFNEYNPSEGGQCFVGCSSCKQYEAILIEPGPNLTPVNDDMGNLG